MREATPPDYNPGNQSRLMLERVPDQSLIAGEAGKGADHVRAGRGKAYAFIYLPNGKPGRGNDWVLVLYDAGAKFAAPGEVQK